MKVLKKQVYFVFLNSIYSISISLKKGCTDRGSLFYSNRFLLQTSTRFVI